MIHSQPRPHGKPFAALGSKRRFTVLKVENKQYEFKVGSGMGARREASGAETPQSEGLVRF